MESLRLGSPGIRVHREVVAQLMLVFSCPERVPMQLAA